MVRFSQAAIDDNNQGRAACPQQRLEEGSQIEPAAAARGGSLRNDCRQRIKDEDRHLYRLLSIAPRACASACALPVTNTFEKQTASSRPI